MANVKRGWSPVNGVLALVITAIIVAVVAVYLGSGSVEPTDNPNPPPGRGEKAGAPP